MTTRRIVPAEADEDMMLAGMDSADRMASATQGDAIIACYTAMLAASPASGKVTEAEVFSADAVYRDAFNAEMRRLVYEEMMTAADATPLASLTGLRTALAFLGLEVG